MAHRPAGAYAASIHSFCFSLIRENAGSLDVDSSFRVLDPAEDDVIAAKAAENVFDDWFDRRPDDMKRLTDFFCPGAKDQRRLAAIIPELRDNILALPFPCRLYGSGGRPLQGAARA